MHGWKDFSPLRKSVSVEVLSQEVQDVAPNWRLRAGWGANELIKKHHPWILMHQTEAAQFFSQATSSAILWFALKIRSAILCLRVKLGRGGVELHYGTVCGRTWTQFHSQPLNSQKKNITATVEIRPPQGPPQLHNLLYLSPSLSFLTFCRPPPPSFARFCDTRISSSRVSN